MSRLALAPGFTLCLVPLDDDRAVRESGRSLGDHDVVTCASAQKAWYPPGSLPEYLRLRDAFAAYGADVPTVDQARATFDALGPLGRYGFTSQGARWSIDNLGPAAFDQDPLATRDWAVYVGNRRLELAGADLARGLSVLARLGGDHTLDEVAATVRGDEAQRAVLGAVTASGALVRRPSRSFSLADLPRVLFVNHSTVFVHDGAHSVLIDPVLGRASHTVVPGRDPADLLAHADAVLISHNHWDHLWYETLVRIPRQTRFLVPRVREPSFANPPIAGYLRALGFTRVEECDPWDEVQVGAIRICTAPFFGEPAGTGSRFDAMTYWMEFGGQTLYGSLDAAHDEAGTMDPVIEALARRGRPDWFLFGSSNQRHEPITLAARMRRLSNELLDRPELVRYHPNVDDVARWSAELRPRTLIPYAEFLFEGAAAPDVTTAPGEAVPGLFGRYWSHFEPAMTPALTEWKADLARLEVISGVPVLPLHPMQGLV